MFAPPFLYYIMVINLSEQYSIINDWLAEIRDKQIQQDRMRFRYNTERIGEIAAYEISKQLDFVEKEVQTPLGTARCRMLKEQPVLATILRAGIPLHSGLSRMFDHADHAFVGAYRKHKEDDSFDIYLEYLSCPELEGRTLILADPMLATGASLVKTLQHLLRSGQPRHIHVVTVIAAREGIRHMAEIFPDITLWAGAIDTKLNAKKYIIPGLGDAGDLAFGPKKQD